jgi:hypothetical protein
MVGLSGDGDKEDGGGVESSWYTVRRTEWEYKHWWLTMTTPATTPAYIVYRVHALCLLCKGYGLVLSSQLSEDELAYLRTVESSVHLIGILDLFSCG